MPPPLRKRAPQAVLAAGPARAPTRRSLLWAALAAVFALSVLTFRIYRTVVSPPVTLLHLRPEDTTLDPPPPPTADDRSDVEQAFHRLSAALSAARQSPTRA